MDNKSQKDNKHAESSLLLKPSSVPTWTVPGNAMLMPVVVGPPEQTPENMEPEKQSSREIVNVPIKEQKSQFAPFLSTEQQQHHHGSVSQLQQPLMVRKSPSPQFDASTSQVSQPSAPLSHIPQPGTYDLPSSSETHSYSNFGVSSGPPFWTQSTISSHSLISEPLSHDGSEAHGHRSNADGLSETGYSLPSHSTSTNEVHVPAAADGSADANDDEFILSHWFFQEIIENKELWYAFSSSDSSAIEEKFQKESEHPSPDDIVIPVIGGRYDIYLKQRQKKPVYWEEDVREIRRCTWFSKEEGSQYYVPYDEKSACILEEHYRRCLSLDRWQQRVLVNNEVVLFDGPKTIIHYKHGQSSWPPADPKVYPVTVYRGVPQDITFLPEEGGEIDHLVFIVQGVGSVCDLRFRSVAQCVDGFREMANRLIPIHFKNEFESGKIYRVEFLPLAWHSSLHEKDIGFDRRMKAITLPSIPKLRHFTNDTLLDILLYSSPVYCQAIINTVANDMNKLFDLFCLRNPNFHGKISVAGHSLGSLILFDLLSNQFEQMNSDENAAVESVGQCSNDDEIKHKKTECSAANITSLFEDLELQDYLEPFLAEKMDTESLMFCDENELKSLGLPMGPRKKLLAFLRQQTPKTDADNHASVVQHDDILVSPAQSNTATSELCMKQQCSDESIYPGNSVYTTLTSVIFPMLKFNPACFFALGSPIAMFLAVRGFSTIREDFCFPTCPSFFHIFHPYDPVAFRIEPLIDPNFIETPVLIPHHKGRKRMHIEIRENITKVGAELRQKVLETLKYTWGHLNVFAKGSYISDAVEAEVDKIVQEEMKARNQETEQGTAVAENVSAQKVCIGCLNGGRRIDYVLQEKPIEALNEYIFALTSHATYWTSEDTALMILKEVYSSQGIISNQNSAEADESSSFSAVTEQPSCSNIPAPLETLDKNYHPSSFSSVSQVPFQDENVSIAEIPVQGQELVASNVPIKSDVNPLLSNDSSSLAEQPLAPPPLSGFVKKSPFLRR